MFNTREISLGATCVVDVHSLYLTLEFVVFSLSFMSMLQTNEQRQH